ncbi:MAG: LemA family protein [Candidatus Uhrbacteria bacterium GW2011_GWE2_45_35]|uniref:LemA family protein n=1 Tax=Candidatus Uhrbacteria bacterium GW2011_GWE2_45_35 TaxID=1618993 RepID=A0A0G1MGL1_9BACT|nr:MAG: LemA family protein [Candidatus Uhrbacteria bacterium GW2011_GWE2_45_35]
MELFFILPAFLVVLAVWFVLVYNGLIKSRNRVDESWSDIEVQMKRRYDLIPSPKSPKLDPRL